MYQPLFDDNLNDADLSPLENFISLNDLIKTGGIKAERAKKIINQFSSTSNPRSTRNDLSEESSAQKPKKSKFYVPRRYKN